MLALGDALALTVLKKRDLNKEDYALFHPGGELGKQLITVEMVMRSGNSNPITDENNSVKNALNIITNTEDAPGAINVINSDNKFVGFFTDGDIRRHLCQNSSFMDKPIKDVMTINPKLIKKDSLATEAYKILRENKIDQLPVIDDNFSPVGIIDVQDLLELGY